MTPAFRRRAASRLGWRVSYSGTLGRTDNCQIGVSISAATDAASCPLDWRVYLPADWDQEAERRAKAHVPDDVRHQPQVGASVAMIDELTGWGLHCSRRQCARM